ncbi:hypothetical protein SUGI_0888640 [Cryptomeria japonica]|nr:hypothetical protein SUGI_0888640 [Cryptomeria japonica]
MKRIENVTNRQVTLSKRKAGLFKKCKELSVLCDAEVAAIVFSDTRKLYHYPQTPGDVNNVVERYTSVDNCPLQNVERNKEEGIYCKLAPYLNVRREKMKELEKENKNMLGEDLGLLSQDELESYERKIEGSIKKIRDKKKQLMMQEITNNENQVQCLQIQNHELKKKIQYFDIYNHELQKRESEPIINEVSTFTNKDDMAYSKYKDSYILNIDPYDQF